MRTHERRRKPAERVAHDHDSAAVADRLDDRVGVLLPTGRLVLAWEVDGDRVVSVLAQRGRNQCQSHALLPPPWMSANVPTAATLSEVPPANASRRDERHRSALVRPITPADLDRLAALAAADREARFTRRPRWSVSGDRIICVALHVTRALRRSYRALQRAPRFAHASERRRVSASDARSGRAATVTGAAVRSERDVELRVLSGGAR
jgi:hypothetical protein